jgi:epoxide hydrolase-like predicted phosphatase
MVVKAVIFDWGGVLIENPAKDLIGFCAEKLGTDQEALAGIFAEYETEYQSGLISESKLWEKVSQQLGTHIPHYSLWKTAVKAVFKDKLDVLDTVKWLRGKGFKTGFLSNTEKAAQEYFEEKGYSDYFDAVVFSCSEGIVKPDPKIYWQVLQKLDIRPSEAVFIDDNPYFVKGAVEIGINGIIFKSFEQMNLELNKFI